MRGILRRYATRRNQTTAASGQATVEFAIASVVFLLIVFGTIDFGRVIFLNAELESAVRDVAREGKVGAANGQGVNIASLENHVAKVKNPEVPNAPDSTLQPRPGLQDADVTVVCTHDPCGSGDTLTVSATLPFSAVTQEFLGIKPLTLEATASVVVE
jgi:Flp pilus assembly protein TadG